MTIVVKNHLDFAKYCQISFLKNSVSIFLVKKRKKIHRLIHPKG